MDEDELPFTPEKVLDETWRTEVYEPKMKIFYDQVVRFNHNVYFAERLLKFPARILGIPAEKTIFLRYILDNAFREAILGICRLTLDEKTYNDSEPYTLLRFYKELKNHLKGPYHENAGTEEKRQLFVYFQQGQFPKQDVLTKKIRNLRNWYFAHLDKVHMTESTEDVQITVKEMKEIRDKLNKRFETLSFNALGSNLFLFPDYAPEIFQSRSSSDIEMILDCIARTGVLLQAPETDADYWNRHRESMSPQAIQTFNYWRKRCGLPEVNLIKGATS